MNYALGCSFGIKDIFEKFKWEKLHFSCNDVYEIIKDYHRQVLVYKIFKDHVQEVLEDIVENNIIFQLPTGAKRSEIRMKVVEGKQFKIARRNGRFRNVDFLSSLYKAFNLALFMYGSGRTRIKDIYVTKELKDKILEKTNQGFNYG